MKNRKSLCAGLVVLACAFTFVVADDIKLYYVDRDLKDTDTVLDFTGGSACSEEQVCFNAINEFRASNGLHPVAWSEDIAAGCRDWSTTMQSRGFDHAPSGMRGGMRENIARGNTDGYRTFMQWRNSSGHRAFLLSRNSTEAAVGKSGNFWTYRARSGSAGYAGLNYAGDARYKDTTHQTADKPVKQEYQRKQPFRKLFRGR